MYEAQGQWIVFLMMANAGLWIGAWDAGMRLVARVLGLRGALLAATDLASALGAGALFFAALMRANYGILRAYTVLAAMGGFWLFRLSVGRLFDRALDGIARIFRKLFVEKRRKTSAHVE